MNLLESVPVRVSDSNSSQFSHSSSKCSVVTGLCINEGRFQFSGALLISYRDS